MIRTARWLGVVAMVLGCSDPSSGPNGSGPGPGPEPPPPPPNPQPNRPPTAAMLSAPVAPPAGGPGAVGGQTYVSMAPGAAGTGWWVVIRSLQSGDSAVALIFHGGFDPVAIPAAVGDTLAVTVVQIDGTRKTAYGVVPRHSSPKVLRTSPQTGRTDVPLNSVLEVVFNEPMDSASLAGALRLQQGGFDVPGAVSGVSTGGVILSARLTPSDSLALLTTYELSVSSLAQSLSGEPLDSAVSVQFTTRSNVGLSRVRVVHVMFDTPPTPPFDVAVDNILVFSSLPYLGSTGYLPLVSGSHVVGAQWPGLQHQEGWAGNFQSGADYTVFPCCSVFAALSVGFQDDNSAPPAGQARIRVINGGGPGSTAVSHVYLTAPGDSLHSVQPLAVTEFEATGYLELPAGDYRVRVTPSDSDSVGIDSGTLTLLAGQVRTLVLAPPPDYAQANALLVLPDRN